MASKPRPIKERLDRVLVAQGLVESRELAVKAVLAGGVRVDGAVVDKPSKMVVMDAPIEVKRPTAFVSRSGDKLAAALNAFQIDSAGVIALDVGCSTGGFTDCLLQCGAAKVYAVDVGYGQLAWRLRQDPRVVVIERCNARYLDRTMIPEKVHVVTIDVSFISLALILPAVDRILDEGGTVLALLKPQFEIGKGKLGKGGVIRDEQARRDTVDQVRRTLEAQGWLWLEEMTSPIAGQKGNVEYVVRLRRGQTAVSSGEMRSIESRWA